MKLNAYTLVTTLFIAASFATTAAADPCGMVPPVYPGDNVPLARTGQQRTYVFYKDGVETIVIRPGFTGKVEEFGMLIPFPAPPAVRKVPDHIFPHIAAAVDPPEIIVNLKPALYFRNSTKLAQTWSSLSVTRRSKVTVLREEAVGMYEVAVLQAGSAGALKKWMDAHNYRFPSGMEKPCNDYVEQGWCFVAVKTRVSGKKETDAAPGIRAVKQGLPPKAAFDGFVQAMGFRFPTKKLVVPMRLSAFNDGSLRNIVYLLSDSPRCIRRIPEEYVVRQISGDQLVKNLTSPLPVRIIGGTEADIPQYRRKTLPQERLPEPKNGAARDLFASDLQSVTTGKLSLAFEEQEKTLLNIGERFSLRGPAIDKLNTASLKVQRDKATEKSLGQLKQMTLTVIDGDFPREVIAGENLTFAEFKMPASRNNAKSYNANRDGPAPEQRGVLKTGQLNLNHSVDAPQSSIAGVVYPIAAMLVSLLAMACVIAMRKLR